MKKRQSAISKKVELSRAVLSYIARRAYKQVIKPTPWRWIASTLWDSAGLALLSWAGFTLHSALGYAVAGLGCFVMAQKFRPSKE